MIFRTTFCHPLFPLPFPEPFPPETPPLFWPGLNGSVVYCRRLTCCPVRPSRVLVPRFCSLSASFPPVHGSALLFLVFDGVFDCQIVFLIVDEIRLLDRVLDFALFELFTRRPVLPLREFRVFFV
jgi:hypothetical protein